MTPPPSPHAVPPKQGHTLTRLLAALRYSLEGLQAAWHEPAWRMEVVLLVVLTPAAFWLGMDWIVRSLLLGSVLLILIVELVNTAIEAVVDRIGPEWHALAKRAKDMGSAAVFLSMLLCAGIWLTALWHKLAV